MRAPMHSNYQFMFAREACVTSALAPACAPEDGRNDDMS